MLNFEMYASGLMSHAGPIFCVFLAAFLQSITGSGLVMVAAPLLMFFYEPKLTIIIMFFLPAVSPLGIGRFLICRSG